ncbi:hypothetical protein RM533_05135 [Croceicoccus sp. F390]|uniref:Lipoprotein n=1 Tax=Croceicoccus esteveae TaxID=3075597 RepID=A0ABU2ZG31_9SPHN|nr:hypothetical protein [Croceicoccus sp. F390]MDT0575562.1 hypothetical protein [Croceicoccus sp. F390]
MTLALCMATLAACSPPPGGSASDAVAVSQQQTRRDPVLTGSKTAAVGQATADRSALAQFARSELQVERFQSARADLDGDGVAETLLYAQSGGWCGSGGCTLFVLQQENGFYRTISQTTIVRPPVRVLDSSSNGWRDLAVRVSGGGAAGKTVRLSHDGSAYPLNPSILPALSLPGGTAGQTLIAE